MYEYVIGVTRLDLFVCLLATCGQRKINNYEAMLNKNTGNS